MINRNEIDVAKFTLLVMEGKNVNEIAIELNISVSTVYKMIKKHNLKLKPNSKLSKLIEEAVYRMIKKHNLKLKPNSKLIEENKNIINEEETKSDNIIEIKNKKLNEFIKMISDDDNK